MVFSMTTGRGTSTTRSTGLCTTRSILFTLESLRCLSQVQEPGGPCADMHKLEMELGQAQQAHGQLARHAAPQGRQLPPATLWGMK